MKLEDNIVDGFLFETEAEAEKAKNEVEKIKQLELKINYNNLDAVAMVYIKGIKNDLFKTIVGQVFLWKLQVFLKQKQYNKIDFEKYPIPIRMKEDALKDHDNKYEGNLDKEQNRGRELKVRINHQTELKRKLRNSRCINAIMIIMVIALFAVAFTGNNPNILNYRQNIINEYSEWEQELMDREAKVREKEKELYILE